MTNPAIPQPKSPREMPPVDDDAPFRLRPTSVSTFVGHDEDGAGIRTRHVTIRFREGEDILDVQLDFDHLADLADDLATEAEEWPGAER